jgi:hypothetical protein
MRYNIYGSPILTENQFNEMVMWLEAGRAKYPQRATHHYAVVLGSTFANVWGDNQLCLCYQGAVVAGATDLEKHQMVRWLYLDKDIPELKRLVVGDEREFINYMRKTFPSFFNFVPELSCPIAINQ